MLSLLENYQFNHKLSSVLCDLLTTYIPNDVCRIENIGASRECPNQKDTNPTRQDLWSDATKPIRSNGRPSCPNTFESQVNPQNLTGVFLLAAESA